MGRRKRKKHNYGFVTIAGAIVILIGTLLGQNLLPEGDDGTDYNKPNIEISEGESTGESSNKSSEKNDLDTMTVHFLDVDQGLSILVQLGDEVLIYDGGERDTSSFVVAYLKEQGITEIDYMISSHYDSDHVSGLIGCLNAFEVKNVIGSNYVHNSKTYTSFMNAVEAEGVEIQYPSVGTVYSFGDATFTILSPDEIKNDSNSNSVAIKLTYGESDFIFTGDADYSSERNMIASGINLDIEVLSLGHHGSASSSSSAFLEKTTPEYAVISCGKDNPYGHPHEEVMELLEVMEIEILRNDEQGTIVMETDGIEITVVD